MIKRKKKINWENAFIKFNNCKNNIIKHSYYNIVTYGLLLNEIVSYSQWSYSQCDSLFKREREKEIMHCLNQSDWQQHQCLLNVWASIDLKCCSINIAVNDNILWVSSFPSKNWLTRKDITITINCYCCIKVQERKREYFGSCCCYIIMHFFYAICRNWKKMFLITFPLLRLMIVRLHHHHCERLFN